MSKSLRINLNHLYSGFSRNLIRSVLVTGAVFALFAIVQLGLRASSNPAIPDQGQSDKRVVLPTEQVRFTIYPEGILPASATVHKGVISILIEDLADANGGVLVERIDGGQRAAVGNLRRSENHFRGRGSVELSPGVYELRVPDKSINPAQLIVEP